MVPLTDFLPHVGVNRRQNEKHLQTLRITLMLTIQKIQCITKVDLFLDIVRPQC